LALAAWAAPVHAQGPADAVERLRQALKASYPDAAARDRATKECLPGLRNLGELRRAATLPEWRDLQGTGEIAAVDQANRAAVTERFCQGLREVLQRNDPTTTVAAVDLLTEMAGAARTAGEVSNLPPLFAADLAVLVRRGQPRVRAAAAHSLGQIGVDLDVAVPALGELLQTNDPTLRRAAADGLAGLLRNVAQPAPNTGTNPAPQLDRREVVAAGCAVLPVVNRGLTDWHTEVRRLCVNTVETAAAVLSHLITAPPSQEQLDADPQSWQQQAQAERADVRPLLLALRDQCPALARTLRDGDADVRLSSQKALEEMARGRCHWLRQQRTLPAAVASSFSDGKPAAADDPLLDGLKSALPALAEGVADPEVRVRRAALDVLEMLGPAAAPAAPALVRALRDPDRFVRWSAVRTLSGVGPSACRSAVPALVQLLEDSDLDLRLAAAAALADLDPTGQGGVRVTTAGAAPTTAAVARTALPALIRSLRATDAEMRVAAIHALQGLGAEARPAVPALREVLGDPEMRVRVAAAEALGALGPAARDAVDDLRAAMKDRSADVRRAAGDALLNIVRAPPRPAAKDR
jgi:HEAT repeat protein